MKNFKYRALNTLDRPVTGTIDATTRKEAIKKLYVKGLRPYKISQMNLSHKPFRYTRIKNEHISRYIRQLSILLGAGVPLLEAMDSLSKSTTNQKLSFASKQIKKDLRSGIKLSTSFTKNIPNIPHFVPKLIELGELTGKSVTSLDAAATQMEFDTRISNEIKSALSYPCFLLLIGSIIIVLMFSFVVPKFENLLGDSENIPQISKFVLKIGTLTSTHSSLWIAISAIGFGLLLLALNKKKQVILKLKHFVEYVPVLGVLFIKIELGKWAKTTGTALNNGANLAQSLKLAQESTTSNKLKSGLEIAAQKIRSGVFIEEALHENISNIDPLYIDLIRTGRSSGKLGEVLVFIADNQADINRGRLKTIVNIMEPLAILGISLVIGTIVIGLVLAMTSIYQVDIL